MAGHLRHHSVAKHITPSSNWIGRQLLLVPEAVALLVLLVIHRLTNASPITALLGLILVVWFGVRMSLLMLVRRRIQTADYAQAERLLQFAFWMHPFSADIYALRGTLDLARGHSAEAVEALRQATIYYPKQAQLHAALSGALLENEESQAAYIEAQHALELDAQCAQAYLHLAGAEQMIGIAPELVERHLREGLHSGIAPADEAALRCALASLLFSQGRNQEARLALAGAESLLEDCPAPQRASLHFCLGEMHRYEGDTDIAHHHFSTSETLDPNGRFAAAAWRAARS